MEQFDSMTFSHNAKGEIEKATLHKADGSKIEFETTDELVEYFNANMTPDSLDDEYDFEPEEGKSWPDSLFNSLGLPNNNS